MTDDLAAHLERISPSALAAHQDHDRPYEGQPHTDYGARGAQQIHGLTLRDVRDAFVLAFFEASGLPPEEWPPTIDELPVDQMDLMAVASQLSCALEKRMGLWPNVPRLLPRDPTEKHWCGPDLDSAEWTSHDGPCPPAPRKQLWCLTCEHTHNADIPEVTWRCHGGYERVNRIMGVPEVELRPCGFGSWDPVVAAEHEELAPGHAVYRLGHVLRGAT